MILTIANHKGGVGKTTTAMLLGQAFRRAGRHVIMMDSDPLEAAAGWDLHIRATGAPGTCPMYVPSNPDGRDEELMQEMQELVNEEPPDTIFILDTGPRDARYAQLCRRIADFILIPTRPAKGDYLETCLTLDQIQVPHAVVLTMTTPGDIGEQKYRTSLTERGIHVLETTIAYDPAIAEIFGTVPGGDLLGYEKVAQELERLVGQLAEFTERAFRQGTWEKQVGAGLFRGLPRFLASPTYQITT